MTNLQKYELESFVTDDVFGWFINFFCKLESFAFKFSWPPLTLLRCCTIDSRQIRIVTSLF